MTQRPAILITGAAKRLGREMALYLAAHGFDIALHYHTSQAEAEQTRRDIQALGAQCALFHADLADAGALPGLIEEVLARFLACAHLINSASIFERASLLESDAALYARTFAVNVTAPVLLSQAFARAASAQSIVNLLDTKVDDVRHAYFFYLLSKKALRDFTLMAAGELAPRVRVNAVCPPKVLPNVHQDDTLPLKATPQEVAQAVHALITGNETGKIVYV